MSLLAVPTIAKLPPELWLMIFKAATSSMPWRAAPSYVSELDGALGLDVHWRMLAEHPPAKLYLGLVCRAWYDLVTPLVYEQVVIKNWNQEQLFMRSLDTSPRRPGRFVRALFIGVGLVVNISVPAQNLIVTSILQNTPNLRVYGFRCAHIFQRPIACTGLNRLTPTHCKLQAVTLHTHSGVVPLALFDFLQSFADTLCSLETSLPRPPAVQAPIHNRHLSFPKLHTLSIVQGDDVSGMVQIARTWSMPSLESFRGLGSSSSFPLEIFQSPDSVASPPPSPVAGQITAAGHSPVLPSTLLLPDITSVTYTGSRVCHNFHDAFPNVKTFLFETEVGRRPVFFMSRSVPSCTSAGIIAYQILPPGSSTTGSGSSSSSSPPSSPVRSENDEEDDEDSPYHILTTLISDQFTPLSNPSTFPSLKLIRVIFLPSQDRWIAPDVRPGKEFFADWKRRVFWLYWKRMWGARGVRLEAWEPSVMDGGSCEREVWEEEWGSKTMLEVLGKDAESPISGANGFGRSDSRISAAGSEGEMTIASAGGRDGDASTLADGTATDGGDGEDEVARLYERYWGHEHVGFGLEDDEDEEEWEIEEVDDDDEMSLPSDSEEGGWYAGGSDDDGQEDDY